MRVTKTIREYIEEQVYTKVKQSAKLAELEQKKDNAIKDFLEDKENSEKVCGTYLNDLIKKYQLVPHRFNPRVEFIGIYEQNLPEVIEYSKTKREIEDKAHKAVLNIIAEMELGGTKAELMEKLDALKF